MNKQRAKAIRKALKITQIEMAEIFGVGQSTVANVENGRNKFTLDQLRVLVEKYSLNPYYYLFGDEPIFIDKKMLAFSTHNTGNSSQDDPNLVQVTNMHTYKNVNLLVPVGAQAGYAHSWPDEYVEDQIQVVKIPGILGEARTVEVKGDSMLPVLEPGDWVVARPIEEAKYIKEGKIYVAVSNTIGLTIKYLTINPDGILCTSANKLAYDPFIIPYEDLKEIWEVKLRITEHLWQSQIAFNNPAQEERIRRLEYFLSKQYPEFNLHLNTP